VWWQHHLTAGGRVAALAGRRVLDEKLTEAADKDIVTRFQGAFDGLQETLDGVAGFYPMVSVTRSTMSALDSDMAILPVNVSFLPD
jgi:hypothetical protein